METARDILCKFDSEGWDEATIIELLLKYINNPMSNDRFRDFLSEAAESGVCKICGDIDCSEHCQKTEHGQHIPDPKSANPPSGVEKSLIVDYQCTACGMLGSVGVDPDDISWE